MELRHLETFVAVAETGTVTAAGKRLRMAQSSVSATLRALEDEVGAPLFARTARKAVLTDVGQAMLPDARATLAGAERALAAVRESLEGVRGHLAVLLPLAVATGTGRPERAVVAAFLAELATEMKEMAPAYRLPARPRASPRPEQCSTNT